MRNRDRGGHSRFEIFELLSSFEPHRGGAQRPRNSCRKPTRNPGGRQFVSDKQTRARRADVNPEFIVAAPNVLHQRVTANDHSCGVVAFESTHRSEAGIEPAMVGFDPIVRVLLGVVERALFPQTDDSAEPIDTAGSVP